MINLAQYETRKRMLKIKDIEAYSDNLLSRVFEMYDNDQETGEHPDATVFDYFEWANEEIKENS